MTSRSTRILEGLGLGLVFSTILIEWAGYASHVSRISYVLAVPALAAVLAFLPRGGSAASGPSPGRLSRHAGSLGLLLAALLLCLGSLSSVFTISLAAVPVAVISLAVSWRGLGALGRRPWAALLLCAMVPPPMPLLDKVNPSLTEISQAYQGKEEQLIKYLKGESEAIVRPKKSNLMKRHIEKTKKLSDADLKSLAGYLLHQQ